MHSFTSFLLIFSWPKQHLLLGLAYQNELSLLKLLIMNTKFYSINKDANFSLLRIKEAILRPMTTKLTLLIMQNQSVKYEVLRQFISLSLGLLALSSAACCLLSERTN